MVVVDASVLGEGFNCGEWQPGTVRPAPSVPESANPGLSQRVAAAWYAFHVERVALFNRLGRASGVTCTWKQGELGRVYDAAMQNYYYTVGPHSWAEELTPAGRRVADLCRGRLEFLYAGGRCCAGMLAPWRNEVLKVGRAYLRAERRSYLARPVDRAERYAALVEESFYAVDLYNGYMGVSLSVWLGRRWQALETAANRQHMRQSPGGVMSGNPYAFCEAEDSFGHFEKVDELAAHLATIRRTKARAHARGYVVEFANQSPPRTSERLAGVYKANARAEGTNVL